MSFLKGRAWIVFLLATGLPAVGSAHHSFSMFDTTKVLPLKGVVKEFFWANPHSQILLSVLSTDARKEAIWALELSSPGRLGRAGWSKASLHPGDPVIVEVNPTRDGSNAGSVQKVTLLATGQVLVANYNAERGPGVR